MKTNEKLELIKNSVIKHHTTTGNVDDTCFHVFSEHKDDIKFSEVMPLVKHVLIAEKLIVPFSDRKEAMVNEVTKMECYDTYTGYNEMIEHYMEKNDVPRYLVINAVRKHYDANEWTIPARLTEWQTIFVAEFKRNPEVTDFELTAKLENSVKTPEKYVVAYAGFVRELIK